MGFATVLEFRRKLRCSRGSGSVEYCLLTAIIMFAVGTAGAEIATASQLVFLRASDGLNQIQGGGSQGTDTENPCLAAMQRASHASSTGNRGAGMRSDDPESVQNCESTYNNSLNVPHARAH